MFFNLFKKKFIDESLEDQKKDLENRNPFLDSLAINGKSCDSLFNNKQDFGHVASNPIPVNGVIGGIKYLNRLRCRCGAGLMYHRLGSIEISETESPIDMYESVCINGKHWDVLFLNIYHPRRSTWLPNGYKFSKFHPIFSTSPIGYGTSKYDKDFPFGLSKYIKIHLGSFGENIAKKYEIDISDRNKFIKPEDHIKKLGFDK